MKNLSRKWRVDYFISPVVGNWYFDCNLLQNKDGVLEINTRVFGRRVKVSLQWNLAQKVEKTFKLTNE